MRKWSRLLIALLMGLTIGLLYGWLVSPLEFVDTSPDVLGLDYRTDIVLMTAETYIASLDPGPAARFLSLIAPQLPAVTAVEALTFARSAGYAPADIALLEQLANALLVYQPGGLP